MSCTENTPENDDLAKAVAEGIASAKAAEEAELRAAAEAEAQRAKLRAEQIDDQKKVSFYEVSVNAYVGSAMELDKSLLTLASGAIAFSLTVVEPVRSSELMMFFYFSSVALFLVTIFSSLLAFKLNLALVRDILNDRQNSGFLMKFFDRSALLSFSVGVLLLAIVGSVSVLKKGEIEMVDKKKTANVEPLNKSLYGLTDLPPGSQYIAESLDGLADLNKPFRVTAAPATITPSPTPAPAKPTTTNFTTGTLNDLKPKA